MEDLDVSVENNQLTIRGRQKDEQEKIYLHRGIAARQFQRSFVLADGIEILGASLDNGLLHIEMKRVQPESKARKIEINGALPAAENGRPGVTGPRSLKAIDIDVQKAGQVK